MSTSEVEAREPQQDEKNISTDAADQSEAKTTLDTPEYGPAPDGGLRAWLVAVGAGCVFFGTLGFSNSFGVFQEYYLTHQLSSYSPDDIAWIGSLSVLLLFAGGALGGPMFGRYGAWVLQPAMVLYVFSLMMMSLSKTYWQLLLTQGVLSGSVMGFMQFAAMAAVSQYFDKKRAAALGVAVAGSSIGGSVLPIAVSKMLNGTSLGFGWTVRIIGFVITPLLFFALVVVRPRLPPKAATFVNAGAFKETKYVMLVLALFLMCFGLFTPLFFLPSYAVTRGVHPTLASYLLAILNAASTFGRIIPGILADKFGRFNMFAAGAFVTGVTLFCMTSATSTAGLIVYAIAYGFSSGTIISGGSASLTIVPKDPRDIGTYVGMGFAISGIASFVGSPLNGALLKQHDGFLHAGIFSGATMLAGACCVLLAKTRTTEGLFGRI